MSEDKKLGLGSVVSISVGLVIATSCLVSLGQGAGTVGVVFIFSMVIACLLNMTTVASLSELNAIMPNTTGGLAQYTLACLGPFPTLISMVGDLAASAIKRNFDIKDYGKLIPGHGGILDRFDSVIFTAPIIFYLTGNLLQLAI